MEHIIRRFDSSLTTMIRSWPDAMHTFFVIITTLGSPSIILLIGAAVVLWGYMSTNMRLLWSGMIVWLTLGIGAMIKIAVGRPRPDTEYAANLHFQTFSFPSGHSSGAMVAYGLLAYLAWHLLPQPWNYIVAGMLIIIIVLVGVSRVYLGAHFPSDVIAGWGLGLIALLIIILVLRPLA